MSYIEVTQTISDNLPVNPLQSVYVWIAAMEDMTTESRVRALRRVPLLQTRYVLLLLMKAIQSCMCHTEVLTSLELEGLPLAPHYLSELVKVRPSSATSTLSPECTDQLRGNRFPCITWTQLLSWELNLINKLSVLWNISLEVIIWKKVDLFAYSCHLVFRTIGSQSVIHLPLGAPQGWSEHL
jgi:hypothetical protein